LNLMEDLGVYIIGTLLILASLGVILVRKPVHSSLCFLLSLLMLATLYLKLSATFIATMQVLVYAGAILVIFMFVIVLFQDAHEQINAFKAVSSPFLISMAAITFGASLVALMSHLLVLRPLKKSVSPEFGTVQTLGKTLYIDYFFPFEAVILLFLIAIIGALYIAKKRVH
jgi:NADH-quinone oxidoreductase subunit J